MPVGRLWMNEQLLFSASTVIFQSPWFVVMCAVKVDLINISHDRRKAQHTDRHVMFCSEQVNFLEK